jgi:PhnB protein
LARARQAARSPALSGKLRSNEFKEKIMASRLNPYLNFDGNARQAMEFYTGVFGGTLNLNTFADYGAQGTPDADRIMHAMLETDAGYTIMAADVTSEMEYHGVSGCSMSLSGDHTDMLRGYWEKLSAGGTITMPLQKQVWGDEFGMCIDQFGVPWLVNITQPAA